MKFATLFLGALAVSAVCATQARADRTITWHFDVPVSPLILGSYGSEYIAELDPAMNYGGGTGSALKITKGPGGTLQIFLAGVWGLNAGDQVTAGFHRYDTTPNGSFSPDSPAARIWAHYNDSLPSDLAAANGSASGNSDYGPGTGWDYTQYTWSVFPGHNGLMIECRAYHIPGSVVWIDDFQVTVPDHAWVITPEGTFDPAPVSVESGSWGRLKALYR